MTIFSFDQFCNTPDKVSPTGHLLDGGLLFTGAGLKPNTTNVHNITTHSGQHYQTTRELNLLPITGNKYANESLAIVKIFDEQFPDWKYIDALANKDIDLLSLILHIPEARACVLHNTRGPVQKTHDEKGDRISKIGENRHVKFCPRMTDTYHCWPHAHPNTTTFLPCPNSYRDDPVQGKQSMNGNVVIAGNNSRTKYMTKYCDSDSMWDKTRFDDCGRSASAESKETQEERGQRVAGPQNPEYASLYEEYGNATDYESDFQNSEYKSENPTAKIPNSSSDDEIDYHQIPKENPQNQPAVDKPQKDKSEVFKKLMYTASTVLAVFSCISLVCSVFAIVIFTTFR